MNTIALSAQTRSIVGRGVRHLRAEDQIPAVMYGHGIAATSLVIPRKTLQTAYDQAGESTLVDLQVDTQAPVKVIIHDVQRDGVSGKLLHVDFYQVNMKEKITAEVPLVFVGEAPAMKELGGVLVKSLNKVEVEALPADLPHELKIDISALKTFEDKITVADIVLPTGVTVSENPKDAVALVEAPRTEEELKALEGEVKEDVAEVEVLTEKKEEPGAEGEVATADKAEPKKEEKK